MRVDNKFYFIAILLILVLILAPVNFIFGQDQPVFRIGVIDNLSGSLASGAQLAIDQINNNGGLEGADGTIFRLEAVVGSPTGMEITLATFAQSELIAVIGPETDTLTLSNLNALQALNVPVFSLATDDTLMALDTSGSIFRARSQHTTQAQAMAKYLAEKLQVQQIAIAQLDVESTTNAISFANAVSSNGIRLSNTFLLDSSATLEEIAQSVVAAQINVLAVFGPADRSGQLYLSLRQLGWSGRFIYNGVQEPQFQAVVPAASRQGILSYNSWSYSYADETSTNFTLDFVKAYGTVPNSLAAASYDAVNLIATGTGSPGDLKDNLSKITDFQGVQGILSPADLTPNEISTNAVITVINKNGSPEAVARYFQGNLIEDEPEVPVVDNLEPTATATPDYVWVEVLSNIQNIRSGPDTVYDIIGKAYKDETYRVIGANVDFTWVVIDYRGQDGWLAEYLLEVNGDRRSVPIVTPPPTPTPQPATATPTVSPMPDMIVTAATPNRLTVGSPFAVTVTVLNQGSAPAGEFAIAATFEPGGVYTSATIPSLAAGASTNVVLAGTLSGTTGPQNVVIVVDLNNQVNEGAAGEANNSSFIFTYTADKTVLSSGNAVVPSGSTINLEGSGLIDLLWDGANLLGQNGGQMYVMTGITNIDQVYFDFINPALAVSNSLDPATINGQFLGILTADGNRAVVKVDSIAGGSNMSYSYRVYQN